MEVNIGDVLIQLMKRLEALVRENEQLKYRIAELEKKQK